MNISQAVLVPVMILIGCLKMRFGAFLQTETCIINPLLSHKYTLVLNLFKLVKRVSMGSVRKRKEWIRNITFFLNPAEAQPL